MLAAEASVADAVVRALCSARRREFDIRLIDPQTASAVAWGSADPETIAIIQDGQQGRPVENLLSPELLCDERRGLLILHGNDSDPALRVPARPGLEFLPIDAIEGDLLLRVADWMVRDARLREQLNAQSRRYELIAHAANDGVWWMDLRTQAFFPSSRWKSLLGYAEGEIGEGLGEWLDRVHPEDLVSLRANLDAHLQGLTPAHEFEHRLCHKNGRYRWVVSRAAAYRDDRGRAVMIAGSLTDISRRKAFEHRLQHDAVTGLASRMTLVERLGASLEALRTRSAAPFSLLFLNMDRFRLVNDSFGLDAGDRVLSQFGERLLGCARAGHLVCRCGGDEFAILVEGSEAAAVADTTAQAIHDALKRPFFVDEQEVFTTASIGILHCGAEHGGPGEILGDVGLAVDAAKRAGAGQTRHFDASLRAGAESTLRLTSALRLAVEREEFEVHYQPIIDLERDRRTGFEALVRWRHPVRGLLSPDEFIPLAEQTGAIIGLGRLVLHEACARAAQWRREIIGAEELAVSVNLSSVQLSSGALLSDVDEALARSGLHPSGLKLELTESALVQDEERARALLGELQRRGVRIYIDDFGTGYSSLGYLDRFEVDGIKIDKSFVRAVGSTDRRAAIVPSIVSLAHGLGLAVVAEGVETDEQLRALRRIGCTEAQGHLFSRPLSREATSTYLAS